MVSDSIGGRIVRTETRLGAPTGEGTAYVTEDGREWRSDPSGCVVNGAAYGRVTGGKFAANVKHTGNR